jgi:hypothetical protein
VRQTRQVRGIRADGTISNKYNLALARAFDRIRSLSVRRNALDPVEGLADIY